MSEEIEEAPTIIQVRAIDIKPNHYGIYCSIASIEGGKPFVNPIVLRRWCEDGQRISFMLDSHNFDIYAWDEMVNVVPYTIGYSETLLAKCDAEDTEAMKHRPAPPPEWLKTYPALLRKWHVIDKDQLGYQSEIIQLAAVLSTRPTV
jgi:hypothetical protein